MAEDASQQPTPSFVIMSTGDATYLHTTLAASLKAIESIRALEADVLNGATLLGDCLKYGGKILICGNGGSAADASHFSTELLCRFEADRKALAAISLTADGSFLTAAGNDYSFDDVFARQVEGLGKAGDVLVVMSTSGKSNNILHALRVARERGLKSMAMLGRNGGDARGIADIEILVPDANTARVQEAHKVIIHLLCGLLERRLFS